MLRLIIQYALVLSTLAPLRSAPDYSAEQETQLLFGETCRVIDYDEGGWYKVVNDYDGYEGWVGSSMLTLISEEQHEQYVNADFTAAVVAPYTKIYSPKLQQSIPVTAGTRLRNYRDGKFEILTQTYTIDPNDVLNEPLEFNYDNLLRIAMPLINIPYVWGGKSCMGMDCSGLSSIVMTLFGKRVLRNASEQATQGTIVECLEDARAGDLVFFNHVSSDSTLTKITHVGIVVTPEIVLHCVGRVHFDYLRDGKLVSSVTGRPTHDIAVIKRY